VCDGNSTNIAEKDKLAPNSSGHLAKTTTDGDNYCAVALADCTTDDTLIPVLVIPAGIISAP